MKQTRITSCYWLAILALSTSLSALPSGAQSSSSQDRDSDLTRQQLSAFDRFLDDHSDMAEQIRSNPSLVNSHEYVRNHPDLQRYLQEHPEVREDLNQNPNAVLHQEQHFERQEDRDADRDRDRDRGNDVTRAEMANMDRFMDSHPEIAEQLRKDPSLINDKQFVKNHPALQQFLAEHPGVREEYSEHPSGFMAREERYDRREDRYDRGGNMERDRDVTHGELRNMDAFMDSHPEIAEQLRKDPSLVDNRNFVKTHPQLQQFLAEHPGVREEYRENPNGFMRQEQRFDAREGYGLNRDHDVTQGELSSFHEFLEGHGNIATELSKNPSLAKNQEYLENHVALRTYLQSNPRVSEELTENPQSFLKSAQTFDTTAAKGTAKVPGTQPKLK